MGRRSRTDTNQKLIVEELRKLGASVEYLSNVGKGVPDLLVGVDGVNFLLEVKSLVTSYGRKGLNDMQQDWHAKWKGQKAVVSNLEEAIQVVFQSQSNKQISN